MRKERWAFCESELADPAKCNTYDELTTSVIDPDNPGEHLEQGVIVYRNGEVSNRWDDGTVGIPADVTELAAEEETLYHPDLDEYTDVWADVLTDDSGAWQGWAEKTPEVRAAR